MEHGEKEINKKIKRKTIVSFMIFFVFIAVGITGWWWLNHQPTSDSILKPLRKGLDANEQVNKNLFSPDHLAKEYPKSLAAKKARVNGDVGMGDFDVDAWRLIVNTHLEDPARDSVLKLSINDVTDLPKRDLTFDFKCIEGWNQFTFWGGTRFIDFLTKYHLGTHSGRAPDPAHPEDMYKYVGLMTPDSAYYVGVDMKSMLHPQTLLAYELNGSPLPMKQGYPVRLIIPIKYGIKSLKRIGYIYFSDTRPRDYWFEKGYDYDAAL